MFRDEWMQAAAFVLLAAIGFYTGYRATLPTHDFVVLVSGTTVAAAPKAEAPAAVAMAAPAATAPAPAPAPTPAATTPTTPPQDFPPTGAAAPGAAAPASDATADAAPAAPQDTAIAATPAPAAATSPAPAPSTTVATLTPPAAPTAAPPPTPVDPMQALQAAANAGDGRAQYALALAYKLGHGVGADTAQSLVWMRRAAQGGLPVAARTLGIAYEEGNGVDKDPTEAAKWYTRAALGGDLQGMHNLAYFFTQGLGGMQRDGSQAEHWIRTAAEHGLVASQINLAILCSQGDQWGIETRLSESYFWSGVAAQHGDAQATRMHDVFAKVFTPREKAALDAKIAAFKPKPIDVAANGGFDVSPEAFLPATARPALSDAEAASAASCFAGLGYGSANDPHPEQAIRDFQTAYGLEATGKADRQLLAALKSVPH